MASFTSRAVQKKNNNRGLYTGKEQSVTGTIVLPAGSSVATTVDLLKMVPVGENVRIGYLSIKATPVAGNPALTNPTFNVGVIAVRSTNLVRPNGDTYPPIATSATALASGLVIPAANEIYTFAVPRPVANSISKYGPFVVTLTPSGAGAFSVAGGDIELSCTVVFEGEGNHSSVYTEFVNQKVK